MSFSYVVVLRGKVMYGILNKNEKGEMLMEYAIQNDILTISVSDQGAELRSIKHADGTEYLWQGDAAIWSDRSPNLFPYIGRMINKQYTYQNHTYPMDIHGIAPYRQFQMIRQEEDLLVFQLTDDDASFSQYPWHFTFQIYYQLVGSRISVTFRVENKDETVMFFAVGGHPGFRVPLNQGEKFEDYNIRFSQPCTPQRILFTPDCFVEDHTVPYPLKNGDSIPLRHNLFDEDAIVLSQAPRSVTLEHNKCKILTVSYPQMPYIGFWHAVGLEAPYVCIEPWSSLPSPKGTVTVLEHQKDLLTLEPGSVYENTWSIEIHNK